MMNYQEYNQAMNDLKAAQARIDAISDDMVVQVQSEMATVKEVQEILNLSYDKIWNDIKKNYLTGIKCKGEWYFNVHEILKYKCILNFLEKEKEDGSKIEAVANG